MLLDLWVMFSVRSEGYQPDIHDTCWKGVKKNPFHLGAVYFWLYLTLKDGLGGGLCSPGDLLVNRVLNAKGLALVSLGSLQVEHLLSAWRQPHHQHHMLRTVRHDVRGIRTPCSLQSWQSEEKVRSLYMLFTIITWMNNRDLLGKLDNNVMHDTTDTKVCSLLF